MAVRRYDTFHGLQAAGYSIALQTAFRKSPNNWILKTPLLFPAVQKAGLLECPKVKCEM